MVYYKNMSNKYKCLYCEKSLSKSNKSRHLKICKMKNKIEHLEQPNMGGTCNTELGPTRKKQGNQRLNWVFTLNNPTEKDVEQIEHDLIKFCKILVYQWEIGEKCKTIHLQGFFVLKKRMRLTELKPINGRAQFKFMKKKVIANLLYCSKSETKIVDKPTFYFGIKPPKVLKVINEDSFYPWQKTLINMLDLEPNDRDIIWIYGDYKTGKTQFVKYMCHKKNCLMVYGAERHILCQVGNNIEKDCYFYMCVKGQSNVPFQAMERIKDGHFCMSFGTKNNRQIIMNSPHLVIFSNEYPNTEHKYFHPDKTKIYKIIDKSLIYQPAIADPSLGSQTEGNPEDF